MFAGTQCPGDQGGQPEVWKCDSSLCEAQCSSIYSWSSANGGN